jgi:very-short-patch-repair endonuclease
MEQASRCNHYLYNKKLRPLARALRRNMTKAQACLWKYVLRAGAMRGHTFNRERPIGNYIADFFCKDLSLIVEVDGITHADDETYENDRRRQHELESSGFKVIRFSDAEVLNRISEVRMKLEHCIEERERELGLFPRKVLRPPKL